jgi:hypothetical protein
MHMHSECQAGACGNYVASDTMVQIAFALGQFAFFMKATMFRNHMFVFCFSTRLIVLSILQQ